IRRIYIMYYFFFQAEDGIRDFHVTGVQTCALPICSGEQGRQLHGVPATASRCRARARQPEISSIASTACPFGLETFGRQPVTQHVGAITLDLDDPVDHGTAATAAGLDPFGQRLELIGGQRQPADGGHRLAAAALGLPAYPGDPVTSRKLWLTADAGILRLSAIGTHASAVSGVHQSTQGSETGLSLGHELNPAPAVDAGRSARRWPGTDSWP